MSPQTNSYSEERHETQAQLYAAAIGCAHLEPMRWKIGAQILHVKAFGEVNGQN